MSWACEEWSVVEVGIRHGEKGANDTKRLRSTPYQGKYNTHRNAIHRCRGTLQLISFELYVSDSPKESHAVTQ